MKNFVTALLSTAMTSVVLGNAFYQKKQFYPAVVYLTKSNPSMAVIYFQIFTVVLFASKVVRQIFFGELRAAEFEHLMENSWDAVTETCLTFTLFRDDFNPNIVALFLLLLFFKSFHWLAESRVDYMERSPIISYLFHIRVLSSVFLLGIIDIFFMKYAYAHTIRNGVSVQMVFGFEYGILLTIVVSICVKYCLYYFNMSNGNPWEYKELFLLYTELILGLFKIFLYVFFVSFMVRENTLPLVALRPMCRTIKAFKKALSDIVLSHQAIRNLNTLYPDATPEELSAADNMCIICRDDMRTASKKLPCNHIFHTSCLTSWFQRQQTCPTCRKHIFRVTDAPTPPAQQAPQETREQPPASPRPQPTQEQTYFSQPNPSPSSNSNSESAEANFRPPPSFPGDPSFQRPRPEELSEEALRLIEESMRNGVKMRVDCLRNIQCLLDSSVLLMQQYNSALEIANRNTTSTISGERSSQESMPSTSSGLKKDQTNIQGPSTSRN